MGHRFPIKFLLPKLKFEEIKKVAGNHIECAALGIFDKQNGRHLTEISRISKPQLHKVPKIEEEAFNLILRFI